MFSEMGELPKRIMVEVSNICNCCCIFCSNSKSKRKKQIIDKEVALKAIYEGKELGISEISFHGMGEPLLCKQLVDYIRLSKELNYQYIYIDTNGIQATPERIIPIIDAGLNSIKFSISASNPDTFKKVQGTNDYTKVINNLKLIANYKRENKIHLKIFVDFVETNYNIGEFEDLKEQIRDYVDEIWFSPCGNQAGNLIEEEVKKIYSKYENKYGLEKKYYAKKYLIE